MKNRKVAVLVTSLMFLFVLTPMAFAAVVTAGPTTLTGITAIVQTIVEWIQTIVLIIAILMIIWAGFTWMTAGGSDDKLTEARQRLIWGLVGLAVVLFAGLAQTFVANIL